jgi:transposase
MLYFGIDWSQDHHNLCILNEAGARLSALKFDHSPTGFAQIEAERTKYAVPASECPVAIETSYNLVVDYLLDYDYPAYLVPPQATRAYRNRLKSSGAHDDDRDAWLLASILRTDREQHRRLQPNSPLTQRMAAQVRLIELLRRSIQRQTNQLRAVLLRVFPQAVNLFSDLTTQISLEFLSAYPTPHATPSLDLEAFRTFLREHGYTQTQFIAQRYAMLQAPALKAPDRVVSAYQNQVQTLALILLPQVRQRKAALTELKQLFDQHPDAEIFRSLPVQGDLLVPALLTKFGDHRERFPSAAEVQALAGTCPVTFASGKRRLVKFRQGCDKEFRRIAQQFAQASLLKPSWATAYWQDLRPHCHSDSHAYRIVANRWLAILWKMWYTHQPYDEVYHLKQRAARSQPKSAAA